MSPLPIIEDLDVVKDLGSRLLARREGAMMDEFVFQALSTWRETSRVRA